MNQSRDYVWKEEEEEGRKKKGKIVSSLPSLCGMIKNNGIDDGRMVRNFLIGHMRMSSRFFFLHVSLLGSCHPLCLISLSL
jgi:hypothetical protein